MTTQTKQIYDPTAGAGGGQKDETPTTGQTVAGAKLKQTKRIVTLSAHALCATFLSVHPAIICVLLTLTLGVLA